MACWAMLGFLTGWNSMVIRCWHLPDEYAPKLAGLVLFESQKMLSTGQESCFHDI